MRLPQAAPGRLRLLYVGLTLVFIGLAVAEFIAMWQIIGRQDALGVDLVFFREMAQRWLDTGTFYTERQLAGPYTTVTLVDNLYPPHAVYLFVPFLVLPSFLWWLMPIGFIAWTIWRLRPRAWTWPVMALILMLPKTMVVLLYGNTDMWISAFVAAAVWWGWPAVLISIKPSVAFLGLIGITRRSWWVAAVVVGVLALPFLPLWIQWISVIRNSTVTAEYSLANIPHMTLALVAWLGATRRAGLKRPERLAPFFARPASPVPDA